ncbi:MAG: PTS transporter subunit EIIB [Firmicutes bacterium]|nr:PTS transporter subunit EIIB [Bacillota bacterium]
MNYIEYIIIFVILIIIAIAITKASKKDFKLDANKLVEYLGGKENIIDYEVNKSRFIVSLKNVDLVNKEAIQKMGAKGIVEIENQLKIILGDNANQLKKYIDELN